MVNQQTRNHRQGLPASFDLNESKIEPPVIMRRTIQDSSNDGANKASIMELVNALKAK